MTEPVESLWGWILGIGVAIIAFLSGRLFRKYDEEIDKIRRSIHAQNDEIHKLGLEIEHITTLMENDKRRK